jgi:hypothetical protein
MVALCMSEIDGNRPTGKTGSTYIDNLFWHGRLSLA